MIQRWYSYKYRKRAGVIRAKVDKMIVVMEKIITRRDGSLSICRKEIPYSKVQVLTYGRGAPGESALHIFATLFAGCDHNKLLPDGRMVYESAYDSTNVFIEAEK
jgi:hypothetical protein